MRFSLTSAAWSTLGLVLLFAVLAGPASAAPAAAAETPPAKKVIAPALVATHQPLVAGAFDRIISFFEGNLGNQRRMLQFGLAMMLLGLWVIWWRK